MCRFHSTSLEEIALFIFVSRLLLSCVSVILRVTVIQLYRYWYSLTLSLTGTHTFGLVLLHNTVTLPITSVVYKQTNFIMCNVYSLCSNRVQSTRAALIISRARRYYF